MSRFLPVLLLSGCDLLPPLSCTEMGCSSGLLVEISGPAEAFAPGDYTVEIEGTEPCTFTIGSIEDCERCIVASTCDASHVDGGEQEQLLLYIEALEGPRAITLERDGTVLLEDSFEPVYEEFEPNGPGCPPVCRGATVELSL